MSLFSTIGNALGSVFTSVTSSASSKSWGDIIGTGLQVGSSLMTSKAQNQAANVAYQNDQLAAQSQLIQAGAQLRASAAEQNEGTYKQIEYNRLANEQTQNASRALTAAAQKAFLIRRAGKETAETALAGYAASGVVTGTGTAAYVPAYIVGRAEEDAFSAYQEGRDTAEQYTNQASAYINAGNQAKSASDTAAAGIREQADAMSALAAMTKNNASASLSASHTSNTANLLASAGSIASQWFR